MLVCVYLGRVLPPAAAAGTLVRHSHWHEAAPWQTRFGFGSPSQTRVYNYGALVLLGVPAEVMPGSLVPH